jgi:hypothetical protein
VRELPGETVPILGQRQAAYNIVALQLLDPNDGAGTAFKVGVIDRRRDLAAKLVASIMDCRRLCPNLGKLGWGGPETLPTSSTAGIGWRDW